MSFPCVLGMHEVGWEDGAYHSNGGKAPKLSGRTNNGGSKATNGSFEVVGGKSNGEVASYLFQRQGVATSFSKTVAEKEEGSFGGKRWSSVGEGMSEQGKKNAGELEKEFHSLTLNNNEKKADTPIEEIATAAKKLWDVQDPDGNKGVSKEILMGDQWRESAWGPSVPHMSQSEHAVSQPIMVQRPAKGGNYNTPESHSILSPRSADGLGYSMVEYVLASSPGGQELDTQMACIKAGFESPPDNVLNEQPVKTEGGARKSNGGSPFEEEAAEELKQSLHREQDSKSPKPPPKSVQEDDKTHPIFSRTPGSRQPSPTSANQQQQQQQYQHQHQHQHQHQQHSQDAHQAGPIQNIQQYHPQIKPRPIIRPELPDERSTPVTLIDPLESHLSGPLEPLGFDYSQPQHIIGTPTSPSDIVMVSHPGQLSSNSQSLQSLHHLTAQQQQQLVLAAAAQQQQQQQQQQQHTLGLQSGGIGPPNPYYIAAAATQDPYGTPSLATVNPGAPPTVVHPQYAYSVQPWGMYQGAANANSFLQQQQQQAQQQAQQQQQQQHAQQAQLLRAGNAGMAGRPVQQLDLLSTGGSPQQQHALAAAGSGGNYQLIAPPGSTPLGLSTAAAAYYDQSGNLVLGNAQGLNNVTTQQMANQLGAPPQLRMVSSMVLNASTTGNNSAAALQGRLNSGNSYGGAANLRLFGQQTQQPQHQANPSYSMSQANALQMNSTNMGMLGSHNLGVLSSSSSVGAIGTLPTGRSRQDSLTSSDYNIGKRQSLAQYYTAPVSSLASLSISAQPSYNTPQELPTPPLLSQGSQSGFTVGSPLSSGLSQYMRLTSGPDKKYLGAVGSMNGSGFSTSTNTFRSSRPKDSGRTRLLEDFRNNRYPNIQLRDLANHIVEFSQDQHGSRFIQQKLERASPGEKQMVFNEILPAAYNLMTDVFGNYVIQKFFEFGSHEQKQLLANCIRGHVLPLALQMYGCRVIQKALESIPPDQSVKIELVRELDGHVLKCVKDQNGNHVVQKCIECADPANLQFIIDAFKGQVYALSTHPYGCRVIQRILEHCTPGQTSPILNELHEHTERLVQDQYGNYVIQHVLEHGTPQDKSVIVVELRGNILTLSQHKFASNVVEKCVSYADRNERAMLIDEVCNSNDGALYTMMKDQFANYVVQKMIDIAEPQQRKLLMHRIRPHVATLRKFTYGKHILAKLEKYYMNMKPQPDFLPLTNGQLM